MASDHLSNIFFENDCWFLIEHREQREAKLKKIIMDYTNDCVWSRIGCPLLAE